ncbi:helix-turn-helix domain-containing protein [Streptomyces telluris]|uniref:MerR family transcriptional regulator n=1 Tax=Streptomyces telluris TaxID=2720021 RepID=A0A9X2LL06_9ACTN|nr:MerR family transcriptional regulator [Streptomyces telluris]MCQ8772871.1 MerR family transcriptional regulator [Streptomyces telluris]NJP79376.1 MerR family transcriptional regulator [Streptomyces telluris]
MDDLTPIRDVADRFELPLSTLHYWERRGLVEPHRRSGRRYFDTEQVYRVALIKLWRETGLMSIEEIAGLLHRDATGTGDTGVTDDTGDGADWQETVHGHIAALDAHIARLNAARAYLGHLLTCAHGDDLEKCPDFRATVPVSP